MRQWIGTKLRTFGSDEGYTGEGVEHYCPACESIHGFAVAKPFRNGAKWSFDGNAEAPTFAPSMNIRTGPFDDGRIDVCHYFLRAGRIEYLGDCTHGLKGQTVDLPDLPPRYAAPERV